MKIKGYELRSKNEENVCSSTEVKLILYCYRKNIKSKVNVELLFDTNLTLSEVEYLNKIF